MLPVKQLAPKILMAVNYCGCQLAQNFLRAAPAYYKKEGATQHPGSCKHSLKYDGRPDGRFGLQVGMWNLGSVSGKGGDICEELRKRMIDVCCLQEVRLKEQGAMMLGMKGGRYKLR